MPGGGANYNLFLFGLNGQVYQSTGTVDQATPIAAAVSIEFTVVVHAMRPGFFVRMKKRPMYYMRARLEWYAIDIVMNGVLTSTAQAYTVGTQSPVPIAGRKSVKNYSLTNLGRPYTVSCPPGLIEGDMVTVEITGNVVGETYLRGVRGYVSATGFEHT